MARETVVLLTCDICQRPESKTVKVEQFRIRVPDGTTREVDLCARDAKPLRELLAQVPERSPRRGGSTFRVSSEAEVKAARRTPRDGQGSKKTPS